MGKWFHICSLLTANPDGGDGSARLFFAREQDGVIRASPFLSAVDVGKLRAWMIMAVVVRERKLRVAGPSCSL